MVLIDTNVFMRLANGAHGAERIARLIVGVTAEVCFINPVIASAFREKFESVATPGALIAGCARRARMIIVMDDTRHAGGTTRWKLENRRVLPRAPATWLPKIRPTGNGRQQEDQCSQFVPTGKLRRRGDRVNRLMPYSHLLRFAPCRASPGRDRSCFASTE